MRTADRGMINVFWVSNATLGRFATTIRRVQFLRIFRKFRTPRISVVRRPECTRHLSPPPTNQWTGGRRLKLLTTHVRLTRTYGTVDSYTRSKTKKCSNERTKSRSLPYSRQTHIRSARRFGRNLLRYSVKPNPRPISIRFF